MCMIGQNSLGGSAMAWLIGIVCVILVVRFWKIFLPVAVLAGIAIGGLWLYEDQQRQQREKKQHEATGALRAKLFSARTANASTQQWDVREETDPASGK